MAINKEFEELLKVALTDGIITPAERQVLLKKAVNLGMDADEADMAYYEELSKGFQDAKIVLASIQVESRQLAKSFKESDKPLFITACR